ncbi:hypothetical protein BBJ28_00018254 [Nothophytophthora sp. Chile5]|nr:hypothetical protein BBJ28_00018254 [Nothophytophthora sp. Chile5]
MKATSFIPVYVAAGLALALTPTAARPMHAGIDYQRYLQEIDSVQSDLDQWRDMFGEEATANGWMPVSEDRSADDLEEDMRQRIFLSQQDVATAQAANPEANFSIFSPFSALTTDEFSTKVMNSYVQGNGSEASHTRTARSLRQQIDFTTAQEMIEALIESIQAQSEAGTVQPASDDDTPAADSDITTEAPATRKPRRQPTAAPSTAAPTTTPTPTTSAPVVEPVTTQPAVASATPATTEEAIVSDGESVDWSASACMSPIQSQGQCGSCWAFASVAAVESAQCIAGGQSSLTKYSEQQLVSCDSQNWGCNGGAPVYAFQYIEQNGLCTEDAYPYTSSSGYSSSCSSSCSKSKTGITGYDNLDTGDENALLDALNTHPVVVAVASGNAAWKQYTGGVMSSCDTSTLDHAVLAVGYDSSNLKIRNSWGENWGESGYVRLKRSTADMGTCGVLTDMSHPQM